MQGGHDPARALRETPQPGQSALSLFLGSGKLTLIVPETLGLVIAYAFVSDSFY